MFGEDVEHLLLQRDFKTIGQRVSLHLFRVSLHLFYVFLSVSQPASPVCTVLWKPVRTEDWEEWRKRCQSVLPEQEADRSTREDSWQAGAMHYSSIIHTECDYWGKTAHGTLQHTHLRMRTPHTLGVEARCAARTSWADSNSSLNRNRWIHIVFWV